MYTTMLITNINYVSNALLSWAQSLIALIKCTWVFDYDSVITIYSFTNGIWNTGAFFLLWTRTPNENALCLLTTAAFTSSLEFGVQPKNDNKSSGVKGSFFTHFIHNVQNYVRKCSCSIVKCNKNELIQIIIQTTPNCFIVPSTQANNRFIMVLFEIYCSQ